jgi:hypothetical protein
MKKEIGYRAYFYAIVLEISSPFQNKETFTFSCNSKLIDSTVNLGEIIKHLTAVFVSTGKEEIPQPMKIGSIIRIHRGEIQSYKNQKIINCRIGISSWVLFDNTTDVSLPIAYTGKHYTWTETDYSKLKAIKTFSKEYFNRFELDFISLKDAANNKPEDFDSLFMILERKEKDDNIILKACDRESIVKIKIVDKRFNNVGPEDIVKLRSGFYEEHTENKIILLKEYSNILIVPNVYLSAKALRDDFQNKKLHNNIKCLLPLYIPLIGKQRVISKVYDDILFQKVLLKDFNKEVAESNKKLFMLSVNFIEIIPKNPIEWLLIRDEKTMQIVKPDIFFADNALTSLPLEKQYFFKFQAYAKDSSVLYNDTVYTLSLCTITGKGNEFIDIGLQREKPTKKHYTSLKKIYKTITRPWNALRIGIEAIDIGMNKKIYLITNTKLKIKYN